MKPVRQEDPLGCGIACVAFVLGMSYKRAKRRFSRPAEAERRGFFCKDIVRALGRGGRRYRTERCGNRRADGTIVFIRRSARYPAGHYLVKSRKGWMDPYLNFQEQKNFIKARAGFRKRLPGRAQYAIVPEAQGMLL